VTTRNRDEVTLPRRLLPNPSVDRVAGVARVDLTAADIAANRAQLEAYDRILAEMQKLNRRLAIGFVFLASLILALALGAAAFAVSIDRRVTNLERRIP